MKNMRLMTDGVRHWVTFVNPYLPAALIQLQRLIETTSAFLRYGGVGLVSVDLLIGITLCAVVGGICIWGLAHPQYLPYGDGTPRPYDEPHWLLYKW